ncbi:MAG: hypothetical protein WC256_05380 [Desulfurivibrionaceae bacterium]|jgi:hypothetical protein
MALNATQSKEIVNYMVGGFGAAPGGYMGDLSAAYEQYGSAAVGLAINNAAASILYAGTTDTAFAAGFMSNLLGSSVSSSAMTAAQGWMVGALNEGYTRGQLMVAAENFFASVGAADATWGAAYSSIQQRISTAYDYTIGAGSAETDLADLQAIVGGGTYILTTGQDTATANIFSAPRGWTPGGNDSLNTLNDDDVLTGSGTNPTLHFTYIDDDTRVVDLNIMPTLNGIETINVAFALSTGAILDLQDSTGVDAVNITRLDNGCNATIDNMTAVPTNLSIAHSSQNQADTVNFFFTQSAVAGNSDATTLTLNDVNLATVVINDDLLQANLGVETVNLVSEGSANSIATNLDIEDTNTLNISGDQNLTVGAITNGAGSLSTVDAAELTGNLDFNISGALMGTTPDGATQGTVAFALTSGTGADTIRINSTAAAPEQVGTNDAIETGDGDDTLAMSATASNVFLINNATPQVTGVEAASLSLSLTGAVSTLHVDMDQMDGDQTMIVQNQTISSNTATFNLANMTAAEATGVTVLHGGSGSNDIADAVINMDVASGVTAAGITIDDGVNNQPRFNVTVYADSDLTFNQTTGAVATGAGNATNTVTSLTITDNDTESNTVSLPPVAAHTGTLTIEGGVAGDFLDLDAIENTQRHATNGTDADGVGFANTVAANTGAIVAATVSAGDYLGDLTLRVGGTTQSITTGSGDDMVIFDKLADSQAGLTISDTVAGGTGTDTLALGGNVAGLLGASEWTHVSGMDQIQLMGNGATYALTLTNGLVDSTDAGTNIAIINDNDPANDTVDIAATAGVGVVSAATITATGLSAANHFSYNGEEGAARTADRFILSDNTVNGANVIDGGAVDNDDSTNSVANGDVLEIRNSAVVTTGDLAGISNVGTIVFNNDQASVHTLVMELTDAVVDAMVDSYHTASVTATETITVNAEDGTIGGGVAAAIVNLDATGLTGKAGLIFTDDAAFSGADTVMISARTAGAAHTLTFSDASDTLQIYGGATDTLTVTVAGAVTSLVYNNGAATLTDTVNAAAGFLLDTANYVGTLAPVGGGGAADIFNLTVPQLDTMVIDGAGGVDTLNIFPTINVALTLVDTQLDAITNVENLVIATTGTGAQSITTGAGFQANFNVGGVDLTTTSSTGAIAIDMQSVVSFTGATILRTTSTAGAQTLVTGTGAATVFATSATGAQNISGIGLTNVTSISTTGAQTIVTGAGIAATVDATSSTGAVNVTTSTLADNVTMETADTAGNVISTGGGNDTIAINLSGTAVSTVGNTITGGTGADGITLALDASVDTIVQADGDSIASTANTTTGVIAAGQTITFGGGLDIVNRFVGATDKMNVGTSGVLVTGIGLDEAAFTATTNIFLSGNYAAGVFTITADGAGADTLLLDTTVAADRNIATADTWVLLQGTNSGTLLAAKFI